MTALNVVLTVQSAFDDAIIDQTEPLAPLVRMLVILACFQAVFGLAMREWKVRLAPD